MIRRDTPEAMKQRKRATFAPALRVPRKRDAGEPGEMPEDEHDDEMHDTAAPDTEIGLLPASFDAETRQIDVVLSTGADVRRFDWWEGKFYTERLSLDPAHVRLDRMNAGAPFLRVHDRHNLESVLGVLMPGSVRIEEGKLLGRVQLSGEESDAEAVRKIGAGLIRGVSIGYDTYAEMIETGAAGEIRTAVDWQPFEASAVPVGADGGAGMRAKGQEHTMNGDAVIAQAKEQGAALERERSKAIRQAGAVIGAKPEFVEALIEGGVTLDAARARLFDDAAERGNAAKVNPSPRVQITEDAADKRYRGVLNALLHRARPDRETLTDEGRHYRGLSLLELARDWLESDGVNTRGMLPGDLAKRALTHTRAGGGFLSTSDFPNVLKDVSNKSLRTAYGEAPITYRAWTRRTTARDFKKKYAVQMGNAPALEKVPESGEFKRGSILDGSESYNLETYGKIIPITRRVLINDDLGAMSQVPQRMAAAAARLENSIVWALLTDNAAMADGVALFHATHANLVSPGAAPSVAQIGNMRSKLALQKNLDAATLIAAQLRFIMVPDALFTTAEKLLKGEIAPATQAEVIPGSMRALTLITEPLLDASSAVVWYGAADPAQIDGIEYAFLEGEDGPAIDSEVDFDTDGLKLRVRHDFGAGVVDFRGLVKNAGA